MGVNAASGRFVRPLAIALLVANIVIVVTGGAVRLTASGLGCPSWPRCTGSSFVVRGELGIHGLIEFSNRMFTFVLVAIAVATWVAVWRARPRRRSLVKFATLLALGIPAQAVLGGITVLTHLNPWLVAGHLLLSMAMVGLSVALLRRIGEGDAPAHATVPAATAWLARATFAAAWLVLYIGTVVTGSGPNAGDASSPRTGLNPAIVAQLHADLVFLLVGLTIGSVFAFRAVGAPAVAQRAARTLLGVEVAQAAVGFTQYFTNLPVGLVAVHMLGAALVSATVTWLLVSVRERPPFQPEYLPLQPDPAARSQGSDRAAAAF